jgi:hypothetical protein
MYLPTLVKESCKAALVQTSLKYAFWSETIHYLFQVSYVHTEERSTLWIIAIIEPCLIWHICLAKYDAGVCEPSHIGPEFPSFSMCNQMKPISLMAFKFCNMARTPMNLFQVIQQTG